MNHRRGRPVEHLMSRFTSIAVLSVVCAISTADPVRSSGVVDGVWSHHQPTLNYFGITAAYSCDALEQHVRDILLHFGARKDAKVDANGCPRGSEVPSHSAWIRTDFYTLSLAASPSTGDATKASWVLRELTPRRPYFLGDGDCELIEQMKDLISQNFSLRDLEYRTECVPHEIVIGSFAVRAKVLMPVDQPSS